MRTSSPLTAYYSPDNRAFVAGLFFFMSYKGLRCCH